MRQDIPYQVIGGPRSGLSARLTYWLAFCFRRDAFVTFVAILLLVDRPHWAALRARPEALPDLAEAFRLWVDATLRAPRLQALWEEYRDGVVRDPR